MTFWFFEGKYRPTHKVVLDIDTFLPTYIGPLLIDIEGNADLEFDFNTKILYLSGYTTQGALYRINTWYGNATLIGNYEGGVGISGLIIPWNWPPPYPPEPPQITGPHYGKINTNYTFSIGAITDPDGDQLYGLWAWGDGNYSGWTGPFNPGETAGASHSWSEPGNYTIRVKLKDIWGAESHWSDPFFIEIVKLKTRFFLGIFKPLNQTEDLIIIKSRFFMVFPSIQIFYAGRTIVMSKDYLGYFGTSFTFGIGGVAII